jgi:hypothetical protein
MLKLCAVFTTYRLCLVKRGQPTKYQFYSRSKKVVPFYKGQKLCQLGYPPPVSVILEDAVLIFVHIICGPGSSVGIATELRAARSGDRIPVGRDFPPVQAGPGAHLASCTVGTGSFPGGMYGRGLLLTTQPLLVAWSWKSWATPLPTLWATTGPTTGTLSYHIGPSVEWFAAHNSVQLIAAGRAFLQTRIDKWSLNNLRHPLIERVVFLGNDYTA